MATLSGTPTVFGTPNDTTTATISTTLASTTVGDIAYCWISSSNGGGTAPVMSSAPSGWSLLGSGVDVGANSCAFWLYRRVIAASEPTALTWAMTLGANTKAEHWCVAGADPAAPELAVSVDVHAGAGASRTTAALNTSAAGVVWSGFCDRSGSTFTSPSPADTPVGSGLNSGAASVYVQYSVSTVAAGTPIAARTITGAATSIGGSFVLVTKEAPGGITADTAAVAVVANDATVAVDPYRTQLLTRGRPYIGHRLVSAEDPVTWGVEHSLKAAQSCLAYGLPIVEISFWLDKNGVPIASHDRNILRMFGVDADITAFSYAELVALTPTGTILGGHPIQRVADLIAVFPTSTVILLDNKRNLDITAVMAFITAYPNYQGRFIIKSTFNAGTNPATSTAAAGRQLGMHAWGYYDEADLGSLDTTWFAFDYLGLNYNASAPAWAQIKAKGLPVWAHVATTAANVATGFAAGADGVMTGKFFNGGFNIVPADTAVVTVTAYDMAVLPTMLTAYVSAVANDMSIGGAPAGVIRSGTVAVPTTRAGTVV